MVAGIMLGMAGNRHAFERFGLKMPGLSTGLNIFNNATKPSQSFRDDVVGRFHVGHQVNDKPVSLDKWRVTTGDPKVADTVADLLGGTDPAEWETKSDRNLEVFTESAEIDVLFEGARSVTTRFAKRGENYNLIYASDGEKITWSADPEFYAVGDDDPEAKFDINDRLDKDKIKARGWASLENELLFRLADESDLGKFQIQSGSRVLASRIAESGLLDAVQGDEPVRASLTLTTASSKAGRTFPVIEIAVAR